MERCPLTGKVSKGPCIQIGLDNLTRESWQEVTMKRLFERRNWTPQAILYLKGTQGRHFISDESLRKNLFYRLQLEKRNQNLNPIPISEAVAMFFESLHKPPEEAREINLDQARILEDNLLNWRK
ncbi:LOW QUALITY PROTEIN: spexin [Macrotis lagotis]|uniref:LOW QUALITY PROTEIN: spexin n=1 Tax=Macrotis lagotis TaxID=92651 RepID=UPI003D693AA8